MKRSGSLVLLIFIMLMSSLSMSGQQLELVVQTGHTSIVNSVAFSPDGKIVASGGSDNSIKLWSVKTGQMLKSLEGHTGK